ncbi:MAG: ABC transporter ATP-binding protein [Alphaproteobacteria bacterium]
MSQISQPLSHTAQALLEVQNLTVKFAQRTILQNLSFSLPPAQSLVIIGASGTGKSVLLKTLLGLLRANNGKIYLMGENVTRNSAAHRSRGGVFGMLFQGGALFDSLPVWQNIMFRELEGNHAINYGMAKARAIELLADVGLPAATADIFPAELSGGMQKRVALARAVATRPKILFFDEPTTGLDPIMADVINGLIIQSVRRLGASAITITHDMASARKIADRIMLLHQGRFIWEGTPAEMDSSSDAALRQFVEGRAEGPLTTQNN